MLKLPRKKNRFHTVDKIKRERNEELDVNPGKKGFIRGNQFEKLRRKNVCGKIQSLLIEQ